MQKNIFSLSVGEVVLLNRDKGKSYLHFFSFCEKNANTYLFLFNELS